MTKSKPIKKVKEVFYGPPNRPSPKKTKRKNRERKQKKMRNMYSGSAMPNPYLYSLMDPDNGAGAKIPDITGVPTGTFQLTADGFYSGGANGDVAFAIVPGMGNYYTVASNTAPGTIAWNGATALPGKSAATSLYAGTRVVSAILKAEFLGNTLYDQGSIEAAWIPRGTTLPTSYSSFNGEAYNEIYPVRGGIEVLYRPVDNSDLEFSNSAFGTTNPFMIIWASGLYITSPPQIRFRVVINYEGIAQLDTTNFVTATQSPPDVASIEEAVTWGQSLTDKVRPFSRGFMETAPSVAEYLKGFIPSASTAGRLAGWGASSVATLSAARAIQRRALTY